MECEACLSVAARCGVVPGAAAGDHDGAPATRLGRCVTREGVRDNLICVRGGGAQSPSPADIELALDINRIKTER
jgi:hypothetical protein